MVDRHDLIARMAGMRDYGSAFMEGAPLAVVVCADLTRNPGASGDWWVMDASAASENLLLAAHAVGLGAVWTGVYPRSERPHYSGTSGIRRAAECNSDRVSGPDPGA